MNLLCAVLGIASYFLHGVIAQGDVAVHGYYTEPVTGITFYTSSEPNGTVIGDGFFSPVSLGGFTWGIALPESALTVDSYDYIGLLIGSLPNGTGWSGVVQGQSSSASMPNHLMLIAWPTGNGDEIFTSLRYATGYASPALYNGTASITQLYTHVNDTNWVMVYKCTRCLIFDDPSQTPFNISTSAGLFEQGWAQSTEGPIDPSDPDSSILQHDNGMGEFKVEVSSATQASYSIWASMTATTTATSVSRTVSPTSTTTSKPVPTSTYDYVVIGAGAGGIPLADKLSESGKSVLLIEKGVASSARWGGTIRPPAGWLDGTNLTWFDVPGECNRMWNGGAGDTSCVGCAAGCTDIDQMAGCVLGGGTAVNSGLWWNPNPEDWDYDFPEGWKSTDMASASSRVFSRIPGTDHPSMDGQRYLQTGFDVITQGLSGAGWTSVTANDVPDQKNRTYAHTPYMYSNGERGGPMATYLVTAMKRPNFEMWLNTSVERIVRTGGHATGLDVIATQSGGYTGRVIVSSGAFGTAKLLFRSGIGPQDQLEVVQSSTDGPQMINETDWIILPVGYNLGDHLNTDTVVAHPNISASYYDWQGSWATPIEADKTSYLNNRVGPLAQAAANIGPMMWEEIVGPDGITRQMQWTARVEASNGVVAPVDNDVMTLSLYLGRGAVSRGRITIGKGLNMVVSTIPYGDSNDLAAIAIALDNMANALTKVPGLTYLYGPKASTSSAQSALNMTGAEFLASVPLTYANIGSRRANHWLGTAKMGTDSGIAGGTSVVDTDTKVYGTDNIFVVDASIFPGIPTTNPSALIVTVAEHASEKILALPVAPVNSTSTVVSISSTSTVVSISSTSTVVLTSSTSTVVSISSTSTVAHSSTSTASSTSSSCAIATSVAVTFNEVVTTTYGQTIKIAGSVSELGNWDTGSAPALSASQYTSSNHLWSTTITLAAGTTFEYKFINVQTSGAVNWESDPNRSYTVPKTCNTVVTVGNTWR
ncbi:hypothetical protein VE03_03484 [Pseudogymnoascus sp. 23342-1-I1]|nr:hypothetical protein VE03_03484 [Pseudogymnoascus sp. 23342-1-I1]